MGGTTKGIYQFHQRADYTNAIADAAEREAVYTSGSNTFIFKSGTNVRYMPAMSSAISQNNVIVRNNGNTWTGSAWSGTGHFMLGTGFNVSGGNMDTLTLGTLDLSGLNSSLNFIQADGEIRLNGDLLLTYNAGTNIHYNDQYFNGTTDHTALYAQVGSIVSLHPGTITNDLYFSNRQPILYGAGTELIGFPEGTTFFYGFLDASTNNANIGTLTAGKVYVPDGGIIANSSGSGIQITLNDTSNILSISGGKIQIDDTTDATTTTDGSIQTDGGLSVAKKGYFGDSITINNADAIFKIQQSGASANNKNWDIRASGESLAIRVVDDAYSAATTAIQIDRTGSTTDYVSIPTAYFGVGITTPSYKFHVYKDVDNSSNIVNENPNSGANAGAITAVKSNGCTLNTIAWGASKTGTQFGYSRGDMALIVTSDATYIAIGATNNIPLILGTSDTARIVIEGTGNIQCASGSRLLIDNTTDATTTTDGSLQTDGGLSVVKDVVIGDDLNLLSDGSIINFGADKDVTLTHIPDTGLRLNSTMQLQLDGGGNYIKSAGALIGIQIVSPDFITLQPTKAVSVGNTITADRKFEVSDMTSTGATSNPSIMVVHGLLTAANGDLTQQVAHFGASVTTQNNSDTISDVCQVRIDEPSITKGTDTITNASSLLITGAPTEGENNYAILVDSGNCNFGGNITVGTSLNSNTGTFTSLSVGTESVSLLNSTLGSFTNAAIGTSNISFANITLGSLTNASIGTESVSLLNATVGSLTNAAIGTLNNSFASITLGSLTNASIGTSFVGFIQTTNGSFTDANGVRADFAEGTFDSVSFNGNASVNLNGTGSFVSLNYTYGSCGTFVADKLSTSGELSVGSLSVGSASSSRVAQQSGLFIGTLTNCTMVQYGTFYWLREKIGNIDKVDVFITDGLYGTNFGTLSTLLEGVPSYLLPYYSSNVNIPFCYNSNLANSNMIGKIFLTNSAWYVSMYDSDGVLSAIPSGTVTNGIPNCSFTYFIGQ